MAFKLNTVRCLDVTVMELSGRISIGESAQFFRDAVRDAVWKGHTKIALDYSNVTYQDSSALGELISAFTVLRNSGGQLVLFNLSDKVKDLFQMTKLYSVFDICDSREAALAHFDSWRTAQFQVSTRRFTNLSVLALAGRLDEECGGSKLLASTNSALELGAESVVFVFSQVLAIDRTGVETLLASCQAVRRRGGAAVFAGVEEPIRAEIAPAALSAGIPVYDTLDSALTALGFKVTHKGSSIEVARA